LTETISELLDQPVKEGSVNAMVTCPLHEDRSPSLSIHLEEGKWKCHSCGEKGNLERLASVLGAQLNEATTYDRLIGSVFAEPDERRDFTPLANAFRLSLERGNGTSAVDAYCSSRALSPSVLQEFSIGWSEQRHAIAFPYWEDDRPGYSRVTAIKYRYRNGSKSYEDGSHPGLYGVTLARGKSTVIVCEGESDTHKAYSELKDTGVGVCGVPGASVSQRTLENWSLDLLYARSIGVAFDADEAGDKGYESFLRVFGDEKVFRVRPTLGKDLCEHSKNGGTISELL
jgi:DNA primase